jgi:hypothetical protein
MVTPEAADLQCIDSTTATAHRRLKRGPGDTRHMVNLIESEA